VCRPLRPSTISGVEKGCEQLLHLSVVRESTGASFRVDQLTVDFHFEDTVLALDQLGLEIESLSDIGRQTGGTGVVVSDDAVFDSHFWHSCPPRRIIAKRPRTAREPWIPNRIRSVFPPRQALESR
jgi:hypothetical protein